MSKFGNKGFMMAEVVVVSVIVATTLVILYTSTSRVTTAFNLRNRYHDLDCLNLSIAINDKLIKTGEINRIISNTDAENIDYYIEDIQQLYQDYNNGNGINNYYINVDNDHRLRTDSITVNKKTTKDYFDYLKKNYDKENNYYIISEICTTEDNCFYYGLGVK